jgi:hypothetical protein
MSVGRGRLREAAKKLLGFLWETNFDEEVETDYERAVVELRDALAAAPPAAKVGTEREQVTKFVSGCCEHGPVIASGLQWLYVHLDTLAAPPAAVTDAGLRAFADKLADAIKARDFRDGWNPFDVQRSCAEMVHEQLEEFYEPS